MLFLVVVYSTTIHKSIMNWISTTTIMFFASVLLYILVRELKKYNLPSSTINLGMLGLPLIPTTAMILASGQVVSLSVTELVAVFLSVLLFSFGGNIASIKGQNLAPNPGFSLIIQKSYGSFTIFLAPILFGSYLGFIDIIGAFIVFIFAGIIAIDDRKGLLRESNHWLGYTIIAYFLFGFQSVVHKYFLASGINIFELLLVMFAVNMVISGMQSYKARKEVMIGTRIIFLLCGVGLLSFIFNFAMIEAYAGAPNIGFVNTANAGSIAALTVVSWLLYRDEINIRKIIGVMGVVFGLVLVFV